MRTGADAARTDADAARTERVREIVRRHGWNVTAYQILNPGFSYWIDPGRDAAVGYIERHGVRVAGGGPVCAERDFTGVVAAFERAASDAGCGVVFFAAEDRLAELGIDERRRTTFPIGAQPMWSPDGLLTEFAAHRSLRAQLHRARNKGVTVQRAGHPDERLLRAMRLCLAQWIRQRPLPPLHFLIETDTLSDLADRRVFIAERHGDLTGFLVATPIPARNGWLVEQLVRGADAPNGTVELLLHHAAESFAMDNASMITLGLAPLARRGEPIVNNAPAWIPLLLWRVREHGRRFFNFHGLEQFKAKFGGAAWSPVYISVGAGTPVARALLAVSAAFSGEPLLRFTGRVLFGLR